MATGSRGIARPASLDPAGPAADDIATLWWILLAVGTAVFVLVVVAFLAPMLRRRRADRRDGVDDQDNGSDAAHRGEVPAAKASRWIVGLGVTMPAVLLAGVLAVSVATMRSLADDAPADSTTIEVVGYQYWWAVRYPDDGITVANELHVPVGEPVELRMTSADVIHSLWAPELHGKLDLLPDGTTTLVIEADDPGVYGGECAEFCGLQHANMGFEIVAQPRQEFEAWLAGQQQPAREPATDAARRGRQAFLDEGCSSCHTIGGVTDVAAGVGPDLTHVASRRTLASDTITNTPSNLERWLRDPEDVKLGTTMPTPDLTDEQVEDIVSYLGGLE